MNSGDSRNLCIDCLRGTSAVIVALFHFNAPYRELTDLYHRFIHFGHLGVPVFFVVSGYCIAAARTKETPLVFWCRRFLRIYPPFGASILLVLAIVGLRWATTGKNDAITLPHSIADWIVMSAGFTSPANGVAGINWVYWSLGYEIAFYVIVGLLPLRWLPAGAIALGVLGFWGVPFPFDRWGLFGLGVATYLWTKNQRIPAGMIAVCCVVSAIRRLPWGDPIAATGTALLIAFPPGPLLRPFRTLWTALATMSYSLYLIHVPVGCFLLMHYSPWEQDRRLGPAVLQESLLLIACLLVAWGFSEWIEQPAHRYARQLSERLKRIPPASPSPTT